MRLCYRLAVLMSVFKSRGLCFPLVIHLPATCHRFLDNHQRAATPVRLQFPGPAQRVSNCGARQVVPDERCYVMINTCSARVYNWLVEWFLGLFNDTVAAAVLFIFK